MSKFVLARIQGYSVINGSSRDIEQLAYEFPDEADGGVIVALTRAVLATAIQEGYFSSELNPDEIVMLSLYGLEELGEEEE